MIRSASKSARVSRTAQRAIPVKNRRPASVDTQFRGSYAQEARRSVSEERKFPLLRSSGSRKSSFNLNDGKRIIKDTRPLHDKAYQRRKINDLIMFLEASEDNLNINTARLMSPSKRDFEIIFQALYNFWNPAYTVRRIEEEGPRILKSLCYPFNINKSAFMYVARTNWPMLLGVLIWMMDLNKFALNTDIKSLVEGGNSTAGQAILFRCISQCYYSGNDNDEDFDGISAKIVRSQLPGDLEELEKESEEKDIQINEVENEIQELDALEKEDSNLKFQIEHYEEYFTKMIKHMELKKNIVEQLQEELEKRQLELNRFQDEIRNKQDAYEAQGFDGQKHLNYLETQKKELIEKLEKSNAKLKMFQDVCWETDIQHSEIIEKVSQVCDVFNESYAKVSEIGNDGLLLAQKINNPIAKKVCEENHFCFPDIKLVPSEFFRDVVCKEYQDNLEEMERKVKTFTNFFKGIAAAQNEKIDDVQVLIAKLSVDLKLLNAQVAENEGEMKSLQKQFSEEIASLESECDKQLKILENLQSEYDERQKKIKDFIPELQALRNLKTAKENELEKYLKKREKVFLQWKRAVEETNKFSEECGEEIFKKIQHLSKKGKCK